MLVDTGKQKKKCIDWNRDWRHYVCRLKTNGVYTIKSLSELYKFIIKTNIKSLLFPYTSKKHLRITIISTSPFKYVICKTSNINCKIQEKESTET